MGSSTPLEEILAEASSGLSAVALGAAAISADDVKAEAASTKGKKGKRKRDPDEPKRPLTAFILHNLKYVGALKKERPDVKMTMSVLAHHWKHETEASEKKEILEKAKELKAEYGKKMSAYRERKASEVDHSSDAVKGDDQPIVPPKKKSKKQRDPLQPKRPLSGFLVHNAKYRSIVKAEHPEAKAKDLMKLLGDHWKVIPAAEKETFQSDAKKKMEVWKKAFEAYKLGKTSAPALVASTGPESAAAEVTGKTPKPSGRKKKKKKSKGAIAVGTTSATVTPADSDKKRKKKRKKSTKKKKKQDKK